MDGMVTVKFMYGGVFEKGESGIVYNGRLLRTIAVDVDEFCWFTIVEEAEKCGYYKRDVDAIFFENPGVGLKRVVDDIGSQVMCKVAVEHKVVECYLVSGDDVNYLMSLIGEAAKVGKDGTSVIKCSQKLTPRRKAQIHECPSKKQGPQAKSQASNLSKSNKKGQVVGIKVPPTQDSIPETLKHKSQPTTKKANQPSTSQTSKKIKKKDNQTSQVGHKSYKGDDMKMMFWNCAHAYNQADFDESLAAMKEVDPRAADAFMRCNPTLFCRAFISIRTVNNVVVNNMAETFNAWIINARSKHLIYMLEEIRSMIMQRLVTKKKEMELVAGPICPIIQAKLEKEKDKAADCQALPSSHLQIYQVDGEKVNFMDRTCTCRKWDVTGVPYSHAVAAIFDMHAVAEDFVHEVYRKDTYLRAYNFPITPCPGERRWPKVDAPLIPPPIKVGPGRPRKKRRRDPHEDPKRSGKLTKHGLQMTCSLCKSKDHNKRKCPNKGTLTLSEPPPKRGRGRPRKLNTPDTNRDQLHNEATAEPSRLGRGGRVISRGGRGGSRGGVRGGSRGGLRGGRVPRGFGILFDGDGNAFTNNLGGHTRLEQPGTPSSSQPTTQVSSNHL